MRVPLVDLKVQHARIRDELLAAVTAVADEQRFILGERVAAFERTFAGICGAAHAVGVASGTDALVLALVALGVRPGDAVIVPSLSFVATAEAVVTAGGQPVFADVDGGSLVVTAETVRAAMDRARSLGMFVRAIVPVHLFGRCADVPAIARAAPDVAILEDAAQAAGASLGDRPAGSLGAAAAFSFFPSKNLGAWGDGGAVVTSDASLAARVRRLRAHGLEKGAHVETGANSRLDALQAAVLAVKSVHLSQWVRARRDAAARYRELLGAAGERVRSPDDDPGHAFNVYAVRIADREAVAAALAAEGIETKAYYATPIHREPAFARLPGADAPLPETDAAAREILALPMFPEITAEQQAHVAKALASATRR